MSLLIPQVVLNKSKRYINFAMDFSILIPSIAVFSTAIIFAPAGLQ